MEFDPKLRSIYAPESAKPGQRIDLGEHNGVRTFARMPATLEKGQILLFRMPESVRAPVEVVIEKKDGLSLGLSLDAEDLNSHPTVVEVAAGSLCAPPDGEKLVRVGDIITHLSGTSAKASIQGALYGTSKPAEMLRAATGTMRLSIMREMPQEALLVLKHGLLSKRSPKSVAGMRAWQQRYFELTPDRLTYFELLVVQSPSGEATIDKVERGNILLDELAGVREHQKANASKRLDLLMKSKRLFELNAFSDDERKEWAETIRQALLAKLSEAAAAVTVSAPPPASAPPAASAEHSAPVATAGEAQAANTASADDVAASTVIDADAADDPERADPEGSDGEGEESLERTVSSIRKPMKVEEVKSQDGGVFFRM